MEGEVTPVYFYSSNQQRLNLEELFMVRSVMRDDSVLPLLQQLQLSQFKRLADNRHRSFWADLYVPLTCRGESGEGVSVMTAETLKHKLDQNQKRMKQHIILLLLAVSSYLILFSAIIRETKELTNDYKYPQVNDCLSY